MTKQNINRLISRALLGQLSEAEQARLDAWRQEDTVNEAFYQRMASQQDLAQRYRTYNKVDSEQAFAQFSRRTRRRRARTMSLRALSIAASIVVLIGLYGVVQWYGDYTRVTPPVLATAVQQEMQQSQKQGAAAAAVEQASDDQAKESLRTSILAALDKLPNAGDLKDEVEEATRVTTKSSTDYWVTLDDGSVVHLDGDSRIIYPEHFGRGDREVALEGEAYFMVAKDRSRRFVVHTQQGDVAVHGTEFNVSTRRGTEVVLIRGSVGIQAAGNASETMLVPGQQGTVGMGGNVAVTKVDTTPYIAWNTGHYTFEDACLSNIMTVIGKWYGRDIIFRDSTVRTITFSGNFDRTTGLQGTIEAITTVTGLSIKDEQGHLIITRN